MRDNESKPSLLGCIFAPFLFVGGMTLICGVTGGAIAGLIFVGVPEQLAGLLVMVLLVFWIGSAASKSGGGNNDWPDGRP